MRTKPSKKAQAFRDFVGTGFGIFGKRRAASILKEAVNTHPFYFRGKRPFAIS